MLQIEGLQKGNIFGNKLINKFFSFYFLESGYCSYLKLRNRFSAMSN